MPEVTIKGEMLDLAKHIIETKRGKFDPREFDDRYEDALAELVRAKVEGRRSSLPARKPAKPRDPVVDLLEALRRERGGEARAPQASRGQGRRTRQAAGARRKAS